MHELALSLSPSLPAATSESLQAWDVAARHALSDNTQRAYASDSRAYASAAGILRGPPFVVGNRQNCGQA